MPQILLSDIYFMYISCICDICTTVIVMRNLQGRCSLYTYMTDEDTVF